MKLFLFLISRNGLSKFVGWAARAHAPKWLLRWAMGRYIRFYNVDLSEVKAPIDSFNTFNEFFTRELQANARPIADEPLVSPVDGVVSQSGPLQGGVLTQVKGKTYTLDGLLGDANEAKRFENGSYATIYLSPRDYHRIHCPADGEITHYSIIPGKLYPVNNMALPRIESLFSVNERWTTYFETDQGAIALVKVGATSVGSISCSYDSRITNSGMPSSVHEKMPSPQSMKKGDELARFNLGSTVVLITENRQESIENIPSDTFVRLGQSLS